MKENVSNRSVAFVATVFIAGFGCVADEASTENPSIQTIGTLSMSLSADTDLTGANASFLGEDEGDYSGESLSSAGETSTATAMDDIIIEANRDEDGGSEAGQTHLIFGKTTSFNLVPNYGFDIDLTGWTIEDGDSASHNPSVGNSAPGTAEVVASSSGSFTRVMYLSPCFTVSPSTSYDIGAEFKVASGETPRCNTELVQYSDDVCTTFAGTYGTGIGVLTSPLAWKQFVFLDLTTSASANSAKLRANCVDNSAQPFTVLIDDAFFGTAIPSLDLSLSHIFVYI